MENRSTSPNITFVTFYSPLSQDQLRQIFETVSVFKFKAEKLPPLFKDWNQYLTVLFRSARKFNPDCDCVLITDEETQPDLPSDVTIVRYPIDKRRMMYEKMRVQIEFLKSYAKDQHVILLDNDMIVQGNLSSIFESNFDMGLTYNIHPSGKLYSLPFCNGVLIFPQKKKDRGIEFLDEVKGIYAKEFGTSEKLMWEGEEHALKKRIGVQSIQKTDTQVIEVGSYRILLLDSEIYNYTSKDTFKMSRYQPDKKILHFKHLRKQDMVTYWEDHLE